MKCGEFSVLDENSDVGQPIPEVHLRSYNFIFFFFLKKKSHIGSVFIAV